MASAREGTKFQRTNALKSIASSCSLPYTLLMIKVTNAAIFFLAAGILTSVSVLSAYQVLFVIPLAYYSFLAIRNKDIQLPKSAYWLLAFTSVALMSLILNFEIIPKPSKNFGRLKYYIYGIGGVFVLRVWLNETSEKIKRFLSNTFLISVIIAGLYTCYEIFLTDSRRAKSLTDTMRYGYGSAMLLLTLLSCLLHRDKIRSWYNPGLGLAALIIGFLGMYLTYTRGALLGFLCGIPFVLYFYKPKLGLSLGAIAVLIVLTLGGFYFFGSGNYESRFLVNKNNTSDVMRRSQWKAAIIAIEERPMLGWGLSNFHTQLKRIKHQYDLDAKWYDDAHSHNLFLETGSGTGLIGLFLFLAWLLTWAWEMLRGSVYTRAFVIPFGVAFVVSSQFEVTFDANNVSMIFFLYALSVAGLKKKV